ncbi:hypothetical protein LOK49_Contig516G00002 [Camellia lanceoleosa]|nr:hypothetical protein LOK49_Contig516G00002 [Camellia lanceoleosa]
MSSAQPFAMYFQVQYSYACNGTHSQVADVLEVIQVAKQGLLLIGAIHREDDIWAALLLAKHLSWPVVADILSGSFLLSNYIKVHVLIGSRITTSKQISWMLEDCFPCSYIVVVNHPSRRDPSHIVTHRIQSIIAQFADCMLKAHISQISSKWCGFLQAVDKMVIKPSVVGGFENAALVARWAQQQGKMSVVSAKFESSLFLSAYLQFSYYLELQKADICMAMNKEPSASIAHGLGTYHWLKEDITAEPLNIRRNPCSGFIEASVDNAGHLLGNFQVENKNNVLVFLHGFLGTGEDWIPIMKAISGSARCIAVDLPGLGRSKMQNHSIRNVAQERSLSIEVVADILQKLIQNITPGKVTLVGYSMGARITLYMALRCASKFLSSYSLRDHPHFKQMVASRLQHDDAHTLAKVLSDSSIGRQLRICNVPWFFGCRMVKLCQRK